MDIDLLSKIVKELILDNDEVALPGIGSFIAEIVPSVFSDKGYTINPPYRRLSFRQKGSGDENMVIDFYARCNNIDTPTASRIIREFLEEMRHVLETKKSIVFPGLGKLRATKENYFFFVADEDLDIYPEGFGLEPISLKTHEETPAEVSATMAVLRSILNPEEAETATAETAKAEEVNRPEETTTAPAEANEEEAEANEEEAKVNAADAKMEEDGTNASETETQTTDTEEAAPAEANAKTVENTKSETSATTARTTSRKPAGSKTWQVIKWTVIILVILAVTALLTFIILAHIAPDFIDSILYTPEELEILNL